MSFFLSRLQNVLGHIEHLPLHYDATYFFSFLFSFTLKSRRALLFYVSFSINIASEYKPKILKVNSSSILTLAGQQANELSILSLPQFRAKRSQKRVAKLRVKNFKLLSFTYRSQAWFIFKTYYFNEPRLRTSS